MHLAGLQAKMQYTKIGNGSYGQVYRKNTNTVVKECDKYDKTINGLNRTIELSTVTELAVLGIDGLKHTPRLQEFQSTPNGKILISMDNGGRTLLDVAKALSMTERINFVTKYAFQLIESCIYLQENGIIHNDIKSSNVLVNKQNNLTLIDFGLCAFETIDRTDTNFISYGTAMACDYGTYTICPPETFVSKSWVVDKYMPWSIGITLCEFLFKTHSFICDFVLSDTERQFYKVYYNNDWIIKHHLGQVYKSRLQVESPLIDFSKYVSIPGEVQNLLSSMLELDPNNRKTLKELYALPIFNGFKDTTSKKTKMPVTGNIAELHCGIVEKSASLCANTEYYKDTRAKTINYVFDVCFTFNKTHIFTHAVTLFDKYCAIRPVEIKDLLLVGLACAYVVQYIDKHKPVPINVFLDTLQWVSRTGLIHVSHLNNVMEDIMFCCNYNIYSLTFDVLIAKSGESVDMVNVLDVMRATPPPYNNSTLLKKYVDKVQLERQASNV